MLKGYHSDIMTMYEKIREEENAKLQQRRAEIEKKLPEVIELERQIGKLCVQLSMSALKAIEDRDSYLKDLKNKITDCRVKKAELLVANGYSPDYLSLQYRCTKCKDTGYIGTQKCSCYRQKLIQLHYKDSDLSDILRVNNFDNFNLEYYSPQRTGEEPESPRKNMEKILSKALNYIKNFSQTNDNLLFYGNSGTGKTFLSHCIAKDLLDKGHFVVYRTAEELIQNLRKIRFENREEYEKLLLDCDLLIIDDLGTEQINEFSKTELFNLLNKRLIKQKKMLVSTNYSLKDLMSIYSERITSRLLGNFNLFKFYGDDIRVTKNLHSIK
ncbi:MAG: ATP-binding protein [Clostridiales bacterium]|uniref:ATP-binding protein n=1 Tax=Clostridium sp. N3C TaxID=1776758 RepID=UPI00092DF26E|nr:ATP-binding protein [Clostridium sp. N3C]NLZ49345.1 ATP-binding protein [Clostridiales bacterium]SCN25335.1 DNA replication protein DnaC [Clostridium sp. N3C]